MPDSALRQAAEGHGKDNSLFRMGMHIPTREEVATLPLDDLAIILDLWMWESPAELIPSPEQIAQVREVLRRRDDADTDAGREIIAACSEYLKE